MNSKFFLLLLTLFLSGCGVKSRPLNPPDTAIQSYTESYTGPGENKRLLLDEEEKQKEETLLKKAK